jgi:hypothetical protein
MKRVIFILGLLLLVTVSSGASYTINPSPKSGNLVWFSDDDIPVGTYRVERTGEYIGEFNTTSTIVFSDSGLIVHVIPTREDLLKDPESLFDATIAFVSDNFVYLFGCGAIIGFLFWRR